MNKTEALEFLELSASASELEIKTRLAEKLAYFNLLSEKSPSAFLRRIHAQNVSKVKSLQKDTVLWQVMEPELTYSEKQDDSILNLESAKDEKKKEISILEKQIIPAVEAGGNVLEESVQQIDLNIENPASQFDQKAENNEIIDLFPDNNISEELIILEAPIPVEERAQIASDTNVNILPDLGDAKPLIIQAEVVESPIDTVTQSENIISSEEPVQLEILSEQKPVVSDFSDLPLVIDLDEKLKSTTFVPTVEWQITQKRNKPLPEPVGWLVRHTENQTVKSFPIYSGKNFIGRKQQPGLKPFIAVEEDPFVSRVHAALYAEGTGLYQFFISDSSASNGGKPSKNGSYVNGNPDRISTKVKLAERDTIQIGISKFVLRYKFSNIRNMLKEVEESEYVQTVVIDPHAL